MSTNQIKRDAYRFMEAKLDYGKGAGTKRKLIKAELDKKMEDDAYKAAFNEALINVDTDDIMRKIEQRKNFQKAYNGAKKTCKTVRSGARFYANNKRWIDIILDLVFGGGR